MPDEREHRITLTIQIDLDPVYGAMHTRRSAETVIQGVLNTSLGHYNPVVTS